MSRCRRTAALVATLVVTSVLVASRADAFAGEFSDDDGHALEPFIEAISALGITAGCGEERYCPDAPVGRDEMAVFLGRGFGYEAGGEPPFDDLEGSFARDWVGAIAERGITAGCAPRLYCPEGNVSRGEMAVFLARALGLADVEAPFDDTTGHFAEGAIGAIAAAGVTAGCASRRYCPDALVTRAEMAVFLTRALGAEPVSLGLLPPPPPTPTPSTPPGAPTCPAGSTVVPAGADIQAAIDAEPAHATFCVEGVHRITQEIVPKDGTVLVGVTGAVINGSAVVTGFAQDASGWSAPWAGAEPALVGQCADLGTACLYADDVFVDGIRLTRVLSIADLSPGEAYVDYANDRVHLADDPAGRTVEISVAPAALDGNGSVRDVTVRGLIVEKCANTAQVAALGHSAGSGWLIEGNEVRANHGAGIEAATNSVVRNNTVHHQGQLGISGFESVGAIVEANDVHNNNTAGYELTFAAGGMKFATSDGVTVRGNTVHDNTGSGIWFDIASHGGVIENNTVSQNTRFGIHYEISHVGVIRANAVSNSGMSGIRISVSADTTVHGNTVVASETGNGITALVQDGRGSGPWGVHELRNLSVHDNAVTLFSGVNGVANDTGDPGRFTAAGNLFANNTYVAPCGNTEPFQYNGFLTWPEWQGQGQDLTGTFSCL